MDAPVRERIAASGRSKSFVSDSDVVIDSLDSYAACFCCNPFEDLLPELVSLQGQAFDMIVVQAAEAPDRVASSDIMITFDHPVSPFPPHHHPSINTDDSNTIENNINSNACCEALLEVEHETQGKVYFPIIHDPNTNKNRLQHPPLCEECGANNNIDDNISTGFVPIPRASQQGDVLDENNGDEMNDHALKFLTQCLKSGRNPVRYLFRTEKRVLGVAHANIYTWENTDRVIVCDVDGTITKSNVKGIVSSIVTEKYDHCHDQVCQFMSSLVTASSVSGNPQSCEQCEHHSTATIPTGTLTEKARAHIMYLSSRPIFLATATRKFLSNLRQPAPRTADGDGEVDSPSSSPITELCHQLPEGPLIGYGGKFMDVMKMELFTYTVHLYKASQLIDQVVTPFCAVSDDPHSVHQNLFVAGFGNTIMDVQAYHMAGMDPSQIYMIDKKSSIRCFNNDQPIISAQTASTALTTNSVNSGGGWSSRLRRIKKKKSDKPSDQVTETDEPRPLLRAPFAKKLYKQCMGTTFCGYQDIELATHVFTKKAFAEE